MAIIIEDGSLVANANSYATEAEMATYAADRGVTITGTSAILLIQAMDFIDGKRFIGSKLDINQSLQWPRTGVLIDGFYIPVDSIPISLKEAQIEVALAYDTDNDPLAIQGRETRREKIGELEVEYTGGSSPAIYLTGAENKMRKLVNYKVMASRA